MTLVRAEEVALAGAQKKILPPRLAPAVRVARPETTKGYVVRHVVKARERVPRPGAERLAAQRQFHLRPEVELAEQRVAPDELFDLIEGHGRA